MRASLLLASTLALAIATGSSFAQTGTGGVVSLTRGPQLSNQASAVIVGVGSDPDGGTPLLVSSRPALGQSLTFVAAGLPSGTTGFLGVSLVPQGPIDIDGGSLYLDPMSAVLSAPFALDAGGGWTASLPLPNDPALAGIQLMTQVFAVVVTGPPVKLAMTNGVHLTFGY